MSKQFTMSKFARKEDLYKAKAEHFEAELQSERAHSERLAGALRDAVACLGGIKSDNVTESIRTALSEHEARKK